VESATKSSRVTLLDIADHCGLSRATVSLVLRESPKIGAATREKVRESMAALGYIYDRNAARLRSGVSRTIGLIIPNITNRFFAGLTAGITRALDENAQVALIGITFDDALRQQELLKQMREYKVDGIMICPASGTEARMLDLAGLDSPPVVQVLRKVSGYRGDYVSADYAEVITLAIDHLVSNGYRRIVYVGSRQDHSAQSDRYGSFLAASHRHQLTDVDAFRAVVSLQGGYDATLEILRRRPRPEALVFYSDVMALGALRAIRELGLIAGRDIALVGCDDLEDTEFSTPKLTTLRLNAQQIGSKGVEVLRQRLQNREKRPESVLFAPELIVRESSLPRPETG
jgi:LacI family transcriptional regulator